MGGLHTNRGAKRAREARHALGLEPATPLPCLLSLVEDDVGVPVIVRVLPQNIAGCLWHDGPRRLVHLNGIHGLARQRFTLAHELGHVRCGHDGAVVVDDVPTISGRTRQPVEIEANAFAAEFLLPRAGLERVLDREPTLDVLVVVAAFYGVSAIMALFRCVTCGLIGDRRADRIRAEIDEGLHFERQAVLDPPVVADRLAAIVEFPYLSPALGGSALAAALGGTASVANASRAARVSEQALAPALEAISAARCPRSAARP